MNHRQAIQLHEAMLNSPNVRAIISTLLAGDQAPADAATLHRLIADALQRQSQQAKLEAAPRPVL